jgi:NAD(P)-dependent dehydrogenase (short-subunit alcohol dehydrogenase family)
MAHRDRRTTTMTTDPYSAGKRPLNRLAGKTTLVTGASRGFGAAIAVRAASEGARVAVHYNRTRAGAEETAQRIAELGGESIIVQADLESWDEIRAMTERVFAEFDGLDVLVNNVGDVASEQMSWRDLDEAVIDRVLAVDIKGTMLMIHEVGTRMMEQGHGTIVNVASTVVVRGSPRAPQYAAGKYGVIGLTKSYARAFAPTVRVNALGPGFIETESTLAREDWRTGRREQLLGMTPMHHIPSPDEITGPVMFLASDDSAHMTGNFVIADGGYSMVGA